LFNLDKIFVFVFKPLVNLFNWNEWKV
jgi:hypothetical protein